MNGWRKATIADLPPGAEVRRVYAKFDVLHGEVVREPDTEKPGEPTLVREARSGHRNVVAIPARFLEVLDRTRGSE